jgi:hypothetical protein
MPPALSDTLIAVHLASGVLLVWCALRIVWSTVGVILSIRPDRKTVVSLVPWLLPFSANMVTARGRTYQRTFGKYVVFAAVLGAIHIFSAQSS